MDFDDVQRQLDDLPNTFKRPDVNYRQWIDSLTSGLVLFTQALEGLSDQELFPDAKYGWMDCWGLLFGVIRRKNEADEVYSVRIQSVIIAWRDSPIAIERWLRIVEKLVAYVNEYPFVVGYRIIFAYLTDRSQLPRIIGDLKYVRPAGVPFDVSVNGGGTYLNTVNYFGAPVPIYLINQDGLVAGNLDGSREGYGLTVNSGPFYDAPSVTGAYLNALPVLLARMLGASTNNAVPLLPDLLFTDQTLNPP